MGVSLWPTRAEFRTLRPITAEDHVPIGIRFTPVSFRSTFPTLNAGLLDDASRCRPCSPLLSRGEVFVHAVNGLILPLRPCFVWTRPTQFCSVTPLSPLVCTPSSHNHVLGVWVCVSPTGFALDFHSLIFPDGLTYAARSIFRGVQGWGPRLVNAQTVFQGHHSLSRHSLHRRRLRFVHLHTIRFELEEGLKWSFLTRGPPFSLESNIIVDSVEGGERSPAQCLRPQGITPQCHRDQQACSTIPSFTLPSTTSSRHSSSPTHPVHSIVLLLFFVTSALRPPSTNPPLMS